MCNQLELKFRIVDKMRLKKTVTFNDIVEAADYRGELSYQTLNDQKLWKKKVKIIETVPAALKIKYINKSEESCEKVKKRPVSPVVTYIVWLPIENSSKGLYYLQDDKH